MQLVSDEQIQRMFPDETDTEALISRKNAAESYIRSRCRIPETAEPEPALVEAVRLLVARYLARRNSPDGTLGMSDFGVGRIATVDRDIEALIAPFRKVVFG